MTVVSWHGPNKYSDGLEGKMDAYRAMSSWLADAPRPLVLGADLNTWRDPVDLIEPEPGEDHYAEHAFVGPDPEHGLIDSYRALLAERNDLDRIRTERPEGPLAFSYQLEGGARYRFDRIFASPHFVPIDGGYLWDEKFRAGSDHGLHWIDLAPSPE
jgi:hypothetical protein